MNSNGRKDRLDRIEDTLDSIREVLRMTALQTAENAKQVAVHNREMKQIRTEFLRGRREHDREMKQIRALFKQV
jgi:hypothetical protein